MPRRRPDPARPDRPGARRLRPSPTLPPPDPWSLEVLVAEIEGRVASVAAERPNEPLTQWLYPVLDAWVRDRDDAWRQERKARGLAIIQEPACQVGCDHCCYQHVAVTDLEAEILARHVRIHLDPDQLAALRNRVDRDARQFRQLAAESPTPEAHRAALARLRQPCPMLDEAAGRCLAYEARPVNCRRENSVDVEVCRRYRFDPDATESSLRLVRYDLLWGAVHVVLSRSAADNNTLDSASDTTEPLAVALQRHFE
ncbi:YkgJ family cysteine cluster protein [Tautonia marina]|uniref:YkgJ family cysteine cluster protein n=1 Tax=Tautonia marina TaxID=2653855 RepID=UPI001375A480|nr:YkgJ family cysteine cluster protein [Tautonia marina]